MISRFMPATVGALLFVAAVPAATTAAVDRDCSDFPSQAAAQAYFDAHGGSPTNDFDNLDGDGDGRVCESMSSTGEGNGNPGSVPPGSRIKATVVEAVDGDTLEVTIRKTGANVDVRLIGIDTPETKRPGTPIECGGPQASALMHRMADDRTVTLVTDPTQDRFDRYGRLLAYVMRDDRLNLNRAAIRRGWAEVYVYNDIPFALVRSFRRAESAAKEEGRGVWGHCDGNFHHAIIR